MSAVPEVRADAAAGAGGRRWSFANAVFDERAFELRVGGQPVELERKSLEVLRQLLYHAGEVVTKDDLLELVWPGRIVSESVPAKCISRIREAVGDDVIKTVHGYGYRLVAPVRVEDPPRPAPASAPAPIAKDDSAPDVLTPVEAPADLASVPMAIPAKVKRPISRGLLTLGLAAAALLALALQLLRPAPVPAIPSIAVLPFANLSAEPEPNEHIVSGLHDTLITQLTRIQNLKVISRTSVLRYRKDAPDLREIGRTLGVAYILEGSVQRSGDRIRVNAQLIETATDHHLWAELYDRKIADLFTLQSELAQRVVSAVGSRLTEAERAALLQRPTAAVSAYELYLRAREHERTDANSQEHLFRAQALLDRAVTEDPEFALAHAALARLHMRMYWFGYDPAPARRELGRAAAERALQLDPGLAESHIAQGMYRALGFRDSVGALESYQRALALQPNSGDLHQRVGSTYRRMGRWDETLANYARALELDPANPALLEDAASLYRGLRRYREADELYERLVSLTPGETFPPLSRATLALEWKGDLRPLEQLLDALSAAPDPDHILEYHRYLLAMWQGRFSDAARILEAYPPEWLPATGGEGRIPKELSLGFAWHLAGEAERAQRYSERARSILETSIRAQPASAGVQLALAQVLARLGERDAALQAVRRALDLMPASVDPVAHTDLALQATVTYVLLGEHETAIAELERLFRLPYGPSAHVVRVLPYWRPLHGDARFQALIAANLPRD